MYKSAAETPAPMFFYKFCKIFKNTQVVEHLQITASKNIFIYSDILRKKSRASSLPVLQEIFYTLFKRNFQKHNILRTFIYTLHKSISRIALNFISYFYYYHFNFFIKIYHLLFLMGLGNNKVNKHLIKGHEKISKRTQILNVRDQLSQTLQIIFV